LWSRSLGGVSLSRARKPTCSNHPQIVSDVAELEGLATRHLPMAHTNEWVGDGESLACSDCVTVDQLASAEEGRIE